MLLLMDYFIYDWAVFHCIHVHLYSFADEHLGYFHVLKIVISAALNLGVHVSVWISFVHI